MGDVDGRWATQDDGENVRLIIPTRLKPSSLLILTIYVALLGFFAVVLVVTLWQATETVTFAAALLPLLALALLIIGYASYLIWNMAGREVVSISSKTVVVGHQLFRFRPVRTFDVGSIRRIYHLRDTAEWALETFWGLRPKSVVISDGKQRCEFGIGLDQEESESLVREITERIENAQAQRLGRSR